MIDISRSSILLNAASFAVKAADWLHTRTFARQRTKSLRSEFYTEVWSHAAKHLGLRFEVLPKDIIRFELPNGERFQVKRNYTTLDKPETLKLAGDKCKVNEILGRHAIPFVDYLEFDSRSIGLAKEFLSQAEVPCVVKPAFGTGGGQGVTTNVESETQFGWACARALRFDNRLLIEHQVPGENYRLLFCHGKLLDIVRRDPPCLTGDGKSSIKQLVRKENERRTTSWEIAQTELRIDQDAIQTLQQQGFSVGSIPNQGEQFQVKTVINDNSADENINVMGKVSESIVEIARRAAEVVGVQLAGVDVITDDPSVSLDESGGVVLEVNTTPGLYVHKTKSICPVAIPILQAMIDQHERETIAGQRGSSE